MSLTTTVPVASVLHLRQLVSGRVHLPTDPGYDAARATFNPLVDQHPALVVEVGCLHDVELALRYADDHGLAVAVQATGHGTARPADGALLLVTAGLDRVEVDATDRTAYVGAGARWGAVLAAAAPHGLAPVLGSSPDVGAVGYTLGGGIGWLARRHGLAIDHVRAFDIVTSDGELRHASASSNPALFWALCGGGTGTLGVVVGMEIGLVAVTEVYAGNLWYPSGDAGEVIGRWREVIADAPEGFTSAVCAMNFPPLPHVPAELRGRSMVAVRGCFDGPLDAGAALFDRFRGWRAPELDLAGPLPFAQMERISNDPRSPIPARRTTEWLTALTDDVIAIVVAHAFDEPRLATMTEILHLGGAAARGTSGCHDRGTDLLLKAATAVPAPELDGPVLDRLETLRAGLAPFTSGGTFLNLCEGDERRERSAGAFSPESLDRLVRLRRMYAADGRFEHGLDLG